jgi:hypothetical protein
MATQLRCRPPTGKVAWPLILVEGEEKSGKSVAAYTLSASAQVGRTFVFDLGEGTADEYAELGPYEVVDHDGTFSDLITQMRAATEQPMADGKPNVIILDDGTNLWELLKDWADSRARRSKKGREMLERDPDAEVDISMNLWTDAKERWYEVVNLLRNWPGIGIIIARGKEVAKVQGGAPVAGQSEWKVDAEKGIAFAATAWVRMTRPHAATLIAVRSLHAEVPAKGLRLPESNPIEHLVFDVLGASSGFVAGQRVMPVQGVDIGPAKNRLMDTLFRCGFDPDAAKAKAQEMWVKEFGLHKPGEHPEVTPAELTALILAATELEAPKKIGAAA